MNAPEKSMTSASAVEKLNDPNCTINIVLAGPIPNYVAASSQNQQDAIAAISQLTIYDIWQTPPFRKTSGTVWIGVMEVLSDNGRAWQININNSGAIAHVLVQGNLATASTEERRAYVEKMVRSALESSLNAAQIQAVSGPCR